MDPGKQCHHELAVQSVHQTAVAWYDGIKVLDAVCPLDGRGQKATERRHKGGKGGKSEGMNLDREHILQNKLKMMMRMGLLSRNARRQNCGIAIDGTDIDNAWDHLREGIGDDLEHLRVEDAGRLQEYWVQLAFQPLGEEAELVGGAREPRKVRHDAAQVPAHDDREDGPAYEALPRLVGGKSDERSADKLSAAQHAAYVGEAVVGNDQHEGEGEPKQSVVHIVHDVLELPDREAKDDDGPAQLVELKLDVTRLHGGDGNDEGSRVQRKGQGCLELVVDQQIVQGGVGFDHVEHKVAVGVEYRHTEPQPLGRPEHGDGILDDVEEGVVPHLDELPEQKYFHQRHQGADVHVSAEQNEGEAADEDEAAGGSDEELGRPPLILGHRVLSHGSAGSNATATVATADICRFGIVGTCSTCFAAADERFLLTGIERPVPLQGIRRGHAADGVGPTVDDRHARRSSHGEVRLGLGEGPDSRADALVRGRALRAGNADGPGDAGPRYQRRRAGQMSEAALPGGGGRGDAPPSSASGRSAGGSSAGAAAAGASSAEGLHCQKNEK